MALVRALTEQVMVRRWHRELEATAWASGRAVENRDMVSSDYVDVEVRQRPCQQASANFLYDYDVDFGL